MKFLIMRLIIINLCLFLNAGCSANNSTLFSSARYSEAFIDDEEPRNVSAGQYVKQQLEESLSSPEIEQFVQNNFLDEGRSFVAIDCRVIGGSIDVFYLNGEPFETTINGLRLYQFGPDSSQVWQYCIRAGESLSKLDGVDYRNISSSGLKAVFVTVFDGANYKTYPYLGFAAFDGSYTENDDAFLKYLYLSNIVRCLMYATEWENSFLHSSTMLLMKEEHDYVENFIQSRIRESEPDSAPVDPFN